MVRQDAILGQQRIGAITVGELEDPPQASLLEGVPAEYRKEFGKLFIEDTGPTALPKHQP